MPTMNTSQRIPFVLEPRLASPDGGVTPGAVAQVQPGSVVWATSNATIVTVEADETGLAGFINSVAPDDPAGPGATLSVTADSDLGAGTVTITGVSDPTDPFHVTQDPTTQAATFTMTFAAPVPKA